MNSFRAAISRGLIQARRIWLILPLYVVGLVLGLVQAWPLLLAGNQDGLRNPFLTELVGGGSDALVDLFIGSPAAGPLALAWGGSTLVLAQLFGLAYTFFSGGMLSVAAGTLPFWAGCRRYFWSFLGLGILLVLLAAVVIVIAGLGGSGLGDLNAGLLVGLLLAQALNVVGEYARAIAIVRDLRSPFRLLAAALTFCLRQLAGVLVLALLGLLLHAAVAALFAGSVRLPLGLGELAVQQLAVVLWLWVKLLRLTWALSYVSSSDASAFLRTSHLPATDP